MPDLIAPGSTGFLIACGTLFLLVVNAVSYGLFGFDKRRVAAGDSGIPAHVLLVFAVLGGWPGAMLGRLRVRGGSARPVVRLSLWGIGAGQTLALVLMFTPVLTLVQDRLPDGGLDGAIASLRAFADPAPPPEEPEAKPLPRRFGPGSSSK